MSFFFHIIYGAWEMLRFEEAEGKCGGDDVVSMRNAITYFRNEIEGNEI